MKVALVGATGLVGRTIITVLEEGKYLPLSSISEFIPVASARSAGSDIRFKQHTYKVKTVAEALALNPDLAIFSAGSETSLAHAAAFAGQGCYVIDNSSAWRDNENIPLVVPEVNIHTITASQKIIANPNCSTIQLAAVIAPLHRKYNIERLVISTYQSVSGSGARAIQQLYDERQGNKGMRVYPHNIDLNLFPHGGTFLPNGYTTEEMKLLTETRKILQTPDLKITATVVRVPVTGGHSESVNIEFKQPFEMDELNRIIRTSKGVVLQDDTDRNVYPMPRHAAGRDEIFVGRVRRDDTIPNAINLWIVADNLRKGAATNAVQIAAHLLSTELIKA